MIKEDTQCQPLVYTNTQTCTHPSICACPHINTSMHTHDAHHIQYKPPKKRKEKNTPLNSFDQIWSHGHLCLQTASIEIWASHG